MFIRVASSRRKLRCDVTVILPTLTDALHSLGCRVCYRRRPPGDSTWNQIVTDTGSVTVRFRLVLIRVSAIPERVDEQIRNLDYVDYSSLSRSSRQTMDPEDGVIDWIATAGAVEKRTFEYHGAARSNPLKVHHRNVLELARRYNWRVACTYDRRTRELMADDKRHDPTTVNHHLVLQVYLDVGRPTPITDARRGGYR